MSKTEVHSFPSQDERDKARIRAEMSPEFARAWVEAGQMPLRRYIEIYGPWPTTPR